MAIVIDAEDSVVELDQGTLCIASAPDLAPFAFAISFGRLSSGISRYSAQGTAIEASAIEMATLNPVDFNELGQMPAHWGIDAKSRVPATRLTFLFRRPLRVGPFRSPGYGVGGLTVSERKMGTFISED